MTGIYDETVMVMKEIREAATLRQGALVVIGCSTSTVLGDKPGTNSDEDVAGELYRGVMDVFGGEFNVAVQCCEHLNRALVVERAVAEKYGFTIVNAVPQKKAGGAFATKHYKTLSVPVVVEDIKAAADLGIDIGGVMVGMHIRPVVVPMKIEHNHIGEAIIIAGKSRLKYIGGERTVYM